MNIHTYTLYVFNLDETGMYTWATLDEVEILTHFLMQNHIKAELFNTNLERSGYLTFI